MTCYPDMGCRTEIDQGDHIRAIGWLAKGKPYSKGPVRHRVREKLRAFVRASLGNMDVLGWSAFRGEVSCELCGRSQSGDGLGVPAGELLFVAPVLIAHYIEEHDYCPPEVFQEALLACPLPGSEAYAKLAEPFKRLHRKQAARLESRRLTEAPERVIFLDFDGVLNHYAAIARAIADGQAQAIDRACVERLNRLAEASDAAVVISSSWRETHSFTELLAILEDHGFRGQVLDVTPSLPASSRGREIRAWLEKHAPQARFVILDDAEDMDELGSYLVRTELGSGLQEEHVAAALAVLHGEGH